MKIKNKNCDNFMRKVISREEPKITILINLRMQSNEKVPRCEMGCRKGKCFTGKKNEYAFLYAGWIWKMRLGLTLVWYRATFEDFL